MKAKYLLPAAFRPIGFIMAVPGLIIGYLYVYHDFEFEGFGFKMREKESLFQSTFENFTNELAILLVVGGLLCIAFAKRKREDELTAKLRLDALYWAVLCSYILFMTFIFLENVVSSGLVWNPVSNNGGIAYNLFMPLLIFVVRYYYLLYKNKDQYMVPRLYYIASKPWGIIGKVLSPFLIAIILYSEFTSGKPDWFNKAADACYFLLFATLMLWAFSKERKEDEAIAQLRLESLQLAVYCNYLLLFVLTLTVYGALFLVVTISYFFSLLLFFALIFEYKKYMFLKQEEKISTPGGLLV